MKGEEHPMRHRLEKWGEWARGPRPQFGGMSSPSGVIIDQRNAAGSHGDGIRYEIIDGVSVPPDGGMAKEVERRGRMIAHDIRCRETHEAVMSLPKRQEEAIRHTFIVAAREEPRSLRAVAELMGLKSHKTVEEYLDNAYEAIERRIYGPFRLADDEELAEAA